MAGASILAACAATAAPVGVAARARVIQPGELVVLTVTTEAESVRLRAFGRDVPAFKVDDRTWRALVGIDLAVKPGRHEVDIDAGRSGRAVHVLRVRAHRFATRRLTLDERFVTPPPSVESRILEEARELTALWKTSSLERLWDGPFVRPVPGKANGRFGTRSLLNGQLRAPHGGADFLSPAGTPIHAPNAGRVVLARELYFTGNTVVIDHGLGLFSLLAHLSETDVREGELVAADQILGRVGATGRVTGPHLHWTVRLNDARVDPLSVLRLLQ